MELLKKINKIKENTTKKIIENKTIFQEFKEQKQNEINELADRLSKEEYELIKNMETEIQKVLEEADKILNI